MTHKEVKEKLKEDLVGKIVPAVLSDVVSFRYFRNNKDEVIGYCFSCREKISTSPMHTYVACPHCKRLTYMTPVSPVKPQTAMRRTTLIVENISETEVIFASVVVNTVMNFDFSLPFDEMVEKGIDSAESKVHFVNDHFYFDAEKGLRRVAANTFAKVNPRDFNIHQFIEDESYQLLIDNWERITGQEFDAEESVSKQMLSYKSQASKKAAQKTAQRNLVEAELLEDMEFYYNQDTMSLIDSEFKGTGYAIETGKVNGIRKYNACCKMCGSRASFESSSDEVYCPDCGEKLTATKYNSGTIKKSYIDFVDAGGMLLTYITNKWWRYDGTLGCATIYAIHGDLVGIKNDNEPKFRKWGDLKCAESLCNENADGCLNHSRGEDIEDIINMTSFAGSGLVEYIKNSKIVNLSPLSLSKRISPSLVTELINNKQFSLTNEMASFKKSNLERCGCKPNAKKLAQFFDCSEDMVKLAASEQMGFDEIISARNHIKKDPNASYDDINWSYTQFSRVSSSADSMQYVLREGFPLAEAREYVTSLYYNQCIGWHEGIRLWAEYLKLLKSIGCTETSLRKPKSLKKALAILKLAKEISDTKAAEITEALKTAERFKKSSDIYELRPPKDTVEIIKEGLCQGQSVAHLLEKISNKETVFLLLRDKSCPEIPLYMVEKTEKGFDVRGNQNKRISDPSVDEFLAES